MGGCCSNDNDDIRRRYPEVYTISALSIIRQAPTSTSSNRACFGEYKCTSCGRKWNSRLAYANKYQICKRCRIHVYPYITRPLRPSDMDSTKDNTKEHQKELCQRCRELGRSCGSAGAVKSRRKF